MVTKSKTDVKKEKVAETVKEAKPVVAKVEETKAAEAPKKKRSAKKMKQITISARRKMSVASASIKLGKNGVRINKMHVESLGNPYVKSLILEPLKIAGDYANGVEIDVTVRGGGTMSQAQAIRASIARALVMHTKDPQLKQAMLSYDRYLLVEDPRQVEPKKYKGRKARARFQKSYR
ncbi:30S ribosomal protein S9 [uncultured archaeon]|nr:30S ribosomal protein S9 [uncultured archaeon]